VQCSIVFESLLPVKLQRMPRALSRAHALWYLDRAFALDVPLPAMPSHPDPATFTISELAQEFALTTRTIRFYEDEGLLAPRRAGQARIYGERERVRIKLILRGKRLGLSLTEIRELLDLYDVSRSERPQLIKFLEVLAARRAMLKQQQVDIAIVLSEIEAFERQCRKRLRRSADAGAP
jgi:DNA-binding transcriptional MerR regulator